MSTEQTTEKLTTDQAQLMAHVHLAEQGLGTGQVEADEQGNPVPPAAESAAGNAAEENKAILQTLIAILTPALPFLPKCYDSATIDRIANAYTAVEEKYGWNVRGMMGVEVQLAIVAIPPTIQAVVLGKAYFEAERRKAEKVIEPDEVKDGGQQ